MRLPRSIVILLVAVLALVAAGVLVTTRTSNLPEASFPSDSPQGVVATYLRLLQNGQVDEAYGLTALEVGPPYFEVMTRERFHAQFDPWSQTPHRVTLLRSSISGDTASVTVEISSFRPDIFGAADRISQHTFTLSRRDGSWRITGPASLF